MHEILAELDPEQRAVATTLGGPVLVLAGAGTGKTRAITHRIAFACLTGQRQARTGLAVTFTRRAAGEMRERLAALGVPNTTARTFHSAALSQLRYFWPQAVGGQFPEVLPSKGRLVARAAGRLGLPTSSAMIRDLTAEVEWAGAGMLLPADYPAAAQAAGRPPLGPAAAPLEHADVARLIAAYHDLKTQANALDFEDILLTLVAIIGDRPDIADQVRAAYQWFTVDEYQDITPLQSRLLRLWLGERDDICVVGDPRQTIYSFAGASPDCLAEFRAAWPGAAQVRLHRCYRCSPEVVAAANSLAGAMPQVTPGARGGTLHSQQPHGPRARILTCADPDDEATVVAGRVADLIAQGVPRREIAILARTNTACAPVELALGRAGIPVTCSGGETFFSRPEVREAVVRLRGAVASGPGRDGGLVLWTTAVLSAMGWAPAGPGGGSGDRERWESLAAIVGLAGELEQRGSPGGADLVAELARRAELSLAPVADAVTLTTLHAAKGLEWDHVFLVGLVEGNLPIVHATTDDQLAEELRLLYVGVTRARVGLVLSWPLTWGPHGGQRTPSRFLAPLRRAAGRPTGEPVVVVTEPAAPAVVARRRERRPPARCRTCGAGLVTAPERTLGRCRTCPATTDEALLAQLQQWRTRMASSQGVPTSVVLTDVTLAALAERVPADHEALARIPGVGRDKAARYGADLLGLVAARGTGPGA